MTTFTTGEVHRLAGLARIAMTDQEAAKLASELEVIANSVARINQFVGPDVPATSHPIPLTNVMREDVVVPTLSQAESLAMAPASEDGRFLVPQILGEDA